MANEVLAKVRSGSMYVNPVDIRKHFSFSSSKRGQKSKGTTEKHSKQCSELLKACVIRVSAAGLEENQEVVCACVTSVEEVTSVLQDRDNEWINTTATQLARLLMVLMREAAKVCCSAILLHCGKTIRKLVGLVDLQENELSEAREAYELMWKASKKQDRKGNLVLRKEALLLICNEDVELSWLSRRMNDCLEAVDSDETAELMQSIYKSILPVIRVKLSSSDKDDLLMILKLHLWHIQLCCTLQEFDVARCSANEILSFTEAQSDNSTTKHLACSLCHLCIGGLSVAKQEHTDREFEKAAEFVRKILSLGRRVEKNRLELIKECLNIIRLTTEHAVECRGSQFGHGFDICLTMSYELQQAEEKEKTGSNKQELMYCLILHARVLESKPVQCAKKLMKAADIVANLSAEVDPCDIAQLTTTVSQCVDKFFESGMKRDAIKLLGKYSHVLIKWCKDGARSDSCMDVIMEIGLISLCCQLSTLLMSDHQLSQSQDVLSEVLRVLPLSELTEENMPGDLVELWVSQEMKLKEQASEYDIRSVLDAIGKSSGTLLPEESEGCILLLTGEINCYHHRSTTACNQHTLKVTGQLIGLLSENEDNITKGYFLVQKGLLIKESDRQEACVCFGEAVRLLSQSESLTCVQKDALATAYLSLALCLYEKCGRQSSSSTTELEDKTVRVLVFDETECDGVEEDLYSPSMEAVQKNLGLALDIWIKLISSTGAEELACCFESLSVSCQNILTTGWLLQLFDQNVLSIKAHCAALRLCSLMSDQPLTVSTLCTAVRLLADIGELGRAATLLQQADDELGQMNTPPEWVVCIVDIEKCRLSWYEGNVSEACQYAMNLLGRPFMDQRYQLPLILQARLFSLCSLLLSVESCDPSLIICLKKRLKSLPLTRLEPLSEAVNIWISLANAKKINEKGTELFLTDKRCDLLWVVLNEVMAGILHLSSVYMEQQLSGNCTGLLKDGLQMAESFKLLGWQSRFHCYLSESYALTGALADCGHHLEFAERLMTASEEDPVAVRDRVQLVLSVAKNRPSSLNVTHRMLDEAMKSLGHAERFEKLLKKYDPEMILPVQTAVQKTTKHVKGLRGRRKQQQLVKKNRLLEISMAEVLAANSERCLAEKDFSQSVELSERGINLLHNTSCKWGSSCQCPLSVTEPVLAARLFYLYAASSLGLSYTDQATESARHWLERSLSLICRCSPVKLLRAVCHCLVFVNAASNPWQSTYYLHLSTACSLNHQAIRLWSEQIRKLNKDGCPVDSEEWLSLLHFQKSLIAHVLIQPSELKAQVSELLPPDWSVCGMGILSLPFVDDQILAITRLQAFSQPNVVLHPLQHLDKEEECKGRDCACPVYVRERLDQLLVDMMDTQHMVKKMWRNARTTLDSSLLSLLRTLEDGWLGCWKGLVFGEVENLKLQQQMKTVAKKIAVTVSKLTGMTTDEEDWRLLLNVFSKLNDKQLEEYIQSVISVDSLTSSAVTKILRQVKDAAGRLFPSCNSDVKRSPVILILDKSVQQLPWESIPLFSHQNVSRMPSLAMLCCHLHSIKTRFHIDPHNAFFILDPEQNIGVMKDKFQKWFTSETGWSGLIAEQPTADHYKKALTEKDLFLYLGHGNGRQYVSSSTIEKLRCRALTFLFGCSSGKLVCHGHMEPTGMPYSYLLAGCPALVGNLWNVLDRDISSFAETILRQLLSDCDNVPLTSVISTARSSCNYKYLIGAAPVIYGLPLIFDTKLH